MASPEYEAFRARAAAQPAPPPPGSIQELRDRIDGAMGKLPLADGTQAGATDAGGVPSILCSRTDGGGDPVLVYFHGGGYRMGSALAWRAYGSNLAAACEARVVLVDYRLAPEHPFPAAVDDAAAAYRWAVELAGSPGRVVVGGDSAGGGLAAALPVAARQRDLPLPAGVVCLSPWVDMRNSAASYETNAAVDLLFSKASADEASALYLAGHDRTDPLVSPVLADWSGFPPLLIQVGGVEVLLDDAAELARVATAAGVDVEHHVYPEMPHVWQINYPAFPEAVSAVEQIAAFIDRVAR